MFLPYAYIAEISPTRHRRETEEVYFHRLAAQRRRAARRRRRDDRRARTARAVRRWTRPHG